MADIACTLLPIPEILQLPVLIQYFNCCLIDQNTANTKFGSCMVLEQVYIKQDIVQGPQKLCFRVNLFYYLKCWLGENQLEQMIGQLESTNIFWYQIVLCHSNLLFQF
jgi:hypothetical protein